MPPNRCAVSPWDLWVLRALDPAADEASVRAMRTARRQQVVWEQALYQRLLDGEVGALQPGRRLLATSPQLASGLVLTLHLGPYQFILEPFLAAGHDLTVLLNTAAERRLRGPAEALSRRLGHRGRLRWLRVEDPGCARSLLRTLRGGGPLLAFADGNQGRGGLAGTRRRGMPYRLPGREIRVRTGLARLVCRTGCAVHPLCVRWTETGSVGWHRQPTQRWSQRDDPQAVTQHLFDWVFSEVQRTPQQWSYWDMLAGTASGLRSGPGARSLYPDYRRAFLLCLARAPHTTRLELEVELAVWPGDVLADLTHDRFYSAEGLQDDDLAALRDRPPTLAALLDRHGRAWVTYHVLRLCLLGVARLRGEALHAAV
jgi:hypothetical protein